MFTISSNFKLVFQNLYIYKLIFSQFLKNNEIGVYFETLVSRKKKKIPRKDKCNLKMNE